MKQLDGNQLFCIHANLQTASEGRKAGHSVPYNKATRLGPKIENKSRSAWQYERHHR